MKRLVIDTDPGTDDTFAIMLAIKSQMFQIDALTTVAGNCSLKYATRNALDILQTMKREDIPVYAGMSKALSKEEVDAAYAHGNNGMGGVFIDEVEGMPEIEHAVDYLVKHISENPHEITIVAIGPLTNIAMAIKNDSSFAKNIKQLVIMGGADNFGNITPYSEFNFYKDPDAAKIVFEAGIDDIVVCGLNVTHQDPLTPELEDLLLKIDTDLSHFLYDITRVGAKFDTEKYGKGYMVHDPITIAYLMNENVISLEKANVTIISRGEREGESVVIQNDNPNCRFAKAVDTKNFYRILFKTIFTEHAQLIEDTISKIIIDK